MARSRYEDEDDDDYEDRPRKRRRRDDDDDSDDRSGGGSNTAIIVVVAIIGVVAFVGIAAALVFVLKNERPAPQAAAPAPEVMEGPAAAPMNPLAKAPRPEVLPPAPVETPKAPAGAVALPCEIPSVSQVVFAGGPTGVAAVVSYQRAAAGLVIDVVQTGTGKALGKVQTTEVFGDGFALSPDGRWLGILTSEPFEGNAVKLHTVADGKEQAHFRPYSKKEDITRPGLIWVGFVGPDLLLTINEGGGFDVWGVPKMERKAGVAAKLTGGSRISVNGFTHAPANFSLTMDGKALAIFNGTGFTFYETATATETGRTEDLIRMGGSALFSGSAFSPDGSRFACYYQTFGAGAATSLRIWDAKTGQNAGGGTVAKAQSPAGFAWWGPNHMLFWEGGISTAKIFEVNSRQVVGNVRTTIPGKLGTTPPNGQMWGVVAFGNANALRGPAALVRADAPAPIPPNADYELSQFGLRARNP